MKFNKTKITVFTLFFVALIPLLFVANMARKEVYYLCGNFNSGVPYSSVTRQLDTISWSSYMLKDDTVNKQIIHSSKFNFHFIKCTIKFDSENKVSSATYSWFTSK